MQNADTDIGQLDYKSLKNLYELKELELNSLLEITQAINNNLPEEQLYRIYNFTLRANLNIRKLALYVKDESEEWQCKVSFGTEKSFEEINLDDRFLRFDVPTNLNKVDKEGPFSVFDLLIPVLHKKNRLAVVFASGITSEEYHLTRHTNSTLLEALSNIIIVAIENKKLARRQISQEALRREMEIAKDVQKLLFPEELPYGPRLKIEASYQPHHTVGGDYYDYIPINKNQFLICIADVSGKGVPAALIMSNFQASLRTLVRQTPNLVEIIQELNYLVLENARGENFITFFGAIYDHQLKTLIYVNSGHNPPLLMTKDGALQHLSDGSTVLGAFHPLPFVNEGFVENLDDFMIFMYTDGLTETFNEQEEEFGLDRMLDYFKDSFGKDLKDIHRGIFEELSRFKGGLEYSDDITMLSCRIEP